MRFLLSVMSVGFATLAFGAYHGFAPGNNIYDLSNPKAFGFAEDSNVLTAEQTFQGSENQCGALPSGTFTLSRDAYFNRFLFDQRGKNNVLAFGPGTMYSVGIDSIAFGATDAAGGTTVSLTSGKMCVPASFDGQTYKSGVVQFARQPLPLTNFTFKVSGETAVLEAPAVNLIYGTNLAFVVENGGTLKTKSIGLGSAKNANGDSVNMGAMNTVRIDGGVLQYGGAETDNALVLGGRAASCSNRLEILNGATLPGWTYLTVDKGIGNVMKFGGSNTEISMVSVSKSSQVNGTGNRLEITNGAKLSLKGNGACIWMGTSSTSVSNVIRVTGTGSTLKASDVYGLRIGESGGSWNRLELDDHACMAVNSLLLGRNGSAASPSKCNVARVAGGSVLRDTNTTIIGHDNAYGISNAMEIVSGGIVSNVACYTSYKNGGHGNSLTIMSGGQLRSSGGFYMTQEGGYGDRFMIDGAGSAMSVVGGFNIGGSSAANPVSNLAVHFGADSVVEVGAMLRAWGCDHRIVVSNGTVRTTDSVQITGWGNTNITTSDNSLTLAGDRPVIRSAKNIEIGAKTKVRFEIDGDGYVEAPLHAPNGTVSFINAGETLEVDVSRLLNRSRDDGAKYYVLAEAKTLTIPDAEVEAAAATLPKGFRLRKDIPAEGPQRLLLRAPSTAGMFLIFR